MQAKGQTYHDTNARLTKAQIFPNLHRGRFTYEKWKIVPDDHTNDDFDSKCGWVTADEPSSLAAGHSGTVLPGSPEILTEKVAGRFRSCGADRGDKDERSG
jgi:hypothetical protein